LELIAYNNLYQPLNILAWILEWQLVNTMDEENNTMLGLKVVFLDEGNNENIRCRFVCDCCKIESYVCSYSRLFSEIEKTHPDVVVMDLNFYAKIDGIETSRKIRSKFDVPVMYF